MNTSNILYENLIRPIQDEMLNKIILENLLTNGKVTLEESKFASDLVENVLTKSFQNDLKTLEESFIAREQILAQNTKYREIQENVIAQNPIQNPIQNVQKEELNESSFIKMFIKK